MVIVYDQWIMETAFWRDGVQWEDAALWHDFPYLFDVWMNSADTHGLWIDRPEPEGVVTLPP